MGIYMEVRMTGTLNASTLSFGEMTWVTNKVNEIKQHPGWQESFDEIKCERLLASESPYTFVLRPGKDMFHYFLSFVEVDGTVQHKLVKIELSARGWLYRNGAGAIRESINDLVSVVMHTTAENCKPYRAVRASMFSLN